MKDNTDISDKTSKINETIHDEDFKDKKRKYMFAAFAVVLFSAIIVTGYYTLHPNKNFLSIPPAKSKAPAKNKKTPNKQVQKVYELNETTAINDVTYTITSAKVTPAPANVTVSDGTKCVTVDLKVANIGTSNIDYDMSDVHAVEAKNKPKNEKPFLNQAGLKSGHLDAGKSIMVPLVFVVPNGSTELYIIYRNKADNDIIRFKVSLG